ncbi:MarR family winged helix-turn-helix transcriptional regulator [Vallicoccus soli]|uniref:MarR family transcriptional regulator n=1 Tax=Vallicoccus soli TaxID=2339232 RepID=A0A3A3YVQ6_9ACTN|nr:MarR family transcriptional regulator [Vallicoccus soli]RJK94849.1 MarR family transcriptional regulator [Vallicoccus soli]
MGQAETVGPVDASVGYALKQAAVALRSGMDAVLRPLELSVPQYSCLEVLAQRPGLSNAELARATFVTRQAMNGVLRGLQERGLVTRPAAAPHGRALPTRLTPRGEELLLAASTAVRSVERRMLAPLDGDRQRRLRDDLAACAAALAGAPGPMSAGTDRGLPGVPTPGDEEQR